MPTDTGSNKTKSPAQLAIEAQNERNLAARQVPAAPIGARPSTSAAANIRSSSPAMPQMPQIQAPQVQSAPAYQSSPAPSLSLNAKPGQESVNFLSQINSRLMDQQAHEKDSLKSSADRAISASHRDISDAAVARKKQKQEELAARGLSSGAGAGAGQLRAVDEAAQTRQARSAADISLARERDQDSLDLQRQAQVNSLYGQAGQAAQVPFNQQMQGNQLNLNAWNSLAQNQLGQAGLAQSGNIANANLQMQGNQMNNQNQMAMWQALMNLQR